MKPCSTPHTRAKTDFTPWPQARPVLFHTVAHTVPLTATSYCRPLKSYLLPEARFGYHLLPEASSNFTHTDVVSLPCPSPWNHTGSLPGASLQRPPQCPPHSTSSGSVKLREADEAQKSCPCSWGARGPYLGSEHVKDAVDGPPQQQPPDQEAGQHHVGKEGAEIHHLQERTGTHCGPEPLLQLASASLLAAGVHAPPLMAAESRAPGPLGTGPNPLHVWHRAKAEAATQTSWSQHGCA